MLCLYFACSYCPSQHSIHLENRRACPPKLKLLLLWLSGWIATCVSTYACWCNISAQGRRTVDPCSYINLCAYALMHPFGLPACKFFKLWSERCQMHGSVNCQPLLLVEYENSTSEKKRRTSKFILNPLAEALCLQIYIESLCCSTLLASQACPFITFLF